MPLPAPSPSRSSHIALRWVGGGTGSHAEEWIPRINAFCTRLLGQFERVSDRSEQAERYGRVSASDQRWLDLRNVTFFLRDIHRAEKLRERLAEGHRFVLAINQPVGMQPEVVGISDFMIKGKEIQGQFTCVNPDIQRWGIAQKMHRAIHGFARKHRLNYFVGQMSPGMTKMYEKFQRDPRLHHQTRLPTEHITITRSREKGALPSAKVRFTSFLRSGTRKRVQRARRMR